ncbi:MAG: hypothetical protein IJX53_02220 [Clostridia bacterium]|nr:hypothetical protein [Clostridia bacterium]
MKWKAIARTCLFLPIWLMIVLTLFSAAALTAVFVNGWDTHPVAYAAYVLAFYTLTVDVLFCALTLPRYYRAIKRRIYANAYGNRYLSDVAFKTHVSLYLSLAINLLYTALNLFSGIWYRSVWFVTLAVYHAILAVMRFLLLRFVNQNGFGKKRILELRRSRLCGIILMTLNLALSGVVVLVIVQNEGFDYPGIMIYVMAMYTFWITTSAIINLIKYRKYNNPVMSTTKIIKLAAALVSMLSLETAMLSQFGSADNPPYFNQVMVGATGAAVCVIVVTMSVYMIVKTTREIKALQNQHP